MKFFSSREIRQAEAEALAGGQALHVWRGRIRDRQETWGHLFDQDPMRLDATARRLGVKIIKIERPGQPGQHVDLWAEPLRRAISECAPGPAERNLP